MRALTTAPLAPGVFTIPDLFDADACEALIANSEALGFERATVNLHSGPVDLPGVRNNDPEGQPAVGLNERWRFYRYEPGQRFKRHRDGTLVLPPRTVDGIALPMGRTLTTLLIYLNDGCEGGETAFFTDAGEEFLRVQPKMGTALCFLHDIRHEGCAVTAGVKYVLRTDILYKP